MKIPPDPPDRDPNQHDLGLDKPGQPPIPPTKFLEYRELGDLIDEKCAGFLDEKGQPEPEFPDPMARNTDPETSHEAAADATFSASRGRRIAMFTLFDYGPLTDFELEAQTGIRRNSIGKRRGDCVPPGFVEKYEIDGELVKRPTESGSLAIVWTLTQAGVKYVRTLERPEDRPGRSARTADRPVIAWEDLRSLVGELQDALDGVEGLDGYENKYGVEVILQEDIEKLLALWADQRVRLPGGDS